MSPKELAELLDAEIDEYHRITIHTMTPRFGIRGYAELVNVGKDRYKVSNVAHTTKFTFLKVYTIDEILDIMS